MEPLVQPDGDSSLQISPRSKEQGPASTTSPLHHPTPPKKDVQSTPTGPPSGASSSAGDSGSQTPQSSAQQQTQASAYSTNPFTRFFSSFWGTTTTAPAPAATPPTDKAPASHEKHGFVGDIPVAKESQSLSRFLDAEGEPVPEAEVAALGDESGQYFVAPPSPEGRGSLDRSAHDASVCLSDFDRISVLGKGSFGKVVLVEKRSTSARYAMKVLKKSKLRRAKQVERTKTERRVLEICENNPFIMTMSYAFQTEEKLYIVLEYCSGGELFFHLSRYRKFPEHVARFYAAELICAIDHLHQHGIVYRDMKPENVLLDSQGHVKLGDFGLAKDNIWEPASGARSICGTPEYMAPEVLNKVGHGQAVDWWGLGMILYEMLTGLPPWYTKDRQKLFQRLRYAPLRIPPTMSVECATCISALLCRNPVERLGARSTEDIKVHPFFTPQGHRTPPAPAVPLDDSIPPPPPAEVDPHFFDWKLLEHRELKPPIDPMEGLELNAEDRNNTANFDPQFTKLEIETDNEEEEPATPYEHFEGFSFMGSGSLEIGSGDDIQTDDIGDGSSEFWSRKRDSCPSAGDLGDVLIDPRPLTVEALNEEIRKMSSASAASQIHAEEDAQVEPEGDSSAPAPGVDGSRSAEA